MTAPPAEALPPHSPLVVHINKGVAAALSRFKSVELPPLSLGSWFAQKNALPRAQEPVDPITREAPDDSEVMFVYQRSNGVVVKCDAGRLIDYMLNTGDFLDPETRQEFEPDALAQLDVFCKRLGKPLISEARVVARSVRAEQMWMQDALQGLERLAGERVAQILDTIEAVNDGEQSADAAQAFILTQILPEFRNLFMQIVQTDRNFAMASRSQYLVFLKGPPNRPYKDKTGLLKQCRGLVRSTCDECFSESL